MTWKDNTIVKFYSRLSHVGIDKNTPDKLRRYTLLGNSINLTTITLIIPYTFLFYFLGIPKLALLLGSFFFLFSFYHYLTYKRHYFLSRTLMVFSLNIILGVYAVVLGRASGIHFLYFVFSTLPFLLYDLKHRLLIAICFISSVVLFCVVRFQLIMPMVIMEPLSLRVISAAMVVLTFVWLLLNKLYLLQANKIVEENVKQSNQLLQSRNRDLEQFAYVASHDLQEPLRTVASYVELLDRQYSDRLDENGHQYMNFILHSTHRLKKLIKDLLDYSRIGRNYQLQKVNFNKLMEEVTTNLSELISSTNTTLTISALPEIEGYATDLKLLLQNLVCNAVKFRKKEDAPAIKIWAEQIDDHWRFAVSDNGIGIEPQHLERIFVIFQRLHTQSEYDGSGIGLSHCKKIVEMHGGIIWVESEYGKGSTFYFTIPI
jgi:signal transduction histidine kinase